MHLPQKHISKVLIVSFALLWLVSCSRPDDETQIHSALSAMVNAVEERDRRGVLEYLAEDFRAEHQLQRVDVNRLMLFYFRQHKNIRIYISDENISVNNPRADVQLKALVTGAKGLIPNAAQNYQVKMRWLREDDKWKLSRLNWQLDS